MEKFIDLTLEETKDYSYLEIIPNHLFEIIMEVLPVIDMTNMFLVSRT